MKKGLWALICQKVPVPEWLSKEEQPLAKTEPQVVKEVPVSIEKMVIMEAMAKSSKAARAQMDMETLFYNLYKARDNWEFIKDTPYRDTMVGLIAKKKPMEYEMEIKHRTDLIHSRQRQDKFRQLGLL